MLDPIPRRFHRVLLPVSSSVASAFPQEGKGSAPAVSREHDFPRGQISGLQIFLMFSPSKFACLPDRSYRCNTAAGQPRLLLPGRTCFVTSTLTRHANRPTTPNRRTHHFPPPTLHP